MVFIYHFVDDLTKEIQSAKVSIASATICHLINVKLINYCYFFKAEMGSG